MKKIIFAVLISLVLVISMAGIAAADESNLAPSESGQTKLTYTADHAFTWTVPAALGVNATGSPPTATISLPALFPQDLVVTIRGEIKDSSGLTKLADATSLVLFHQKMDLSLDPDTKILASLTETVDSGEAHSVGITKGAFSLSGVTHTTAEDQEHNISLVATLTSSVPKGGIYEGKITYTVGAAAP